MICRAHVRSIEATRNRYVMIICSHLLTSLKLSTTLCLQCEGKRNGCWNGWTENTNVKPLLSRKVSAGHVNFARHPTTIKGLNVVGGVDGSEPMIIDIYGAASAELSARIEQLSASGQVGLQHLADADIEGAQKTNRIRQRQVRAFRTNGEVFDPEGARELMSVSYPLAFFDIETSRVPLPYAPGMAPYQQTVFQFSVHILRTQNRLTLNTTNG